MIKIGDWVRIGRRIEKVNRVGDELVGLERIVGLFNSSLPVLTLADFFDVIGQPVPLYCNGSKRVVHLVPGSTEFDATFASENDTGLCIFDGSKWLTPEETSAPSWQLFIDHWDSLFDLPDISRLPLADAWNAIPPEAQELFLEKVSK